MHGLAGGGQQVTLTVRGTCYADEHNHANWKAFHGVAPYFELDNRRQATWIVLYWIHPYMHEDCNLGIIAG